MATESYVHSPSNEIYDYSNFGTLLDAAAIRTPDKECNVFYDAVGSRKAYRFKEISEQTLLLAAGLLKIGLKPGDRVAIYGKPSPEYLMLDYATIRIKVLLLRIPDSVMARDDLLDFLNQYKCQMLFVDPEKISRLGVIIPNFSTLIVGDNLLIEAQEQLQKVVLTGVDDVSPNEAVSIESLIVADVDTSEVQSIQATIDPDEDSTVWPTSGSTGLPKFVVYSNFALQTIFRLYRRMLSSVNLRIDDTGVFNNRPYNWVASMAMFPAVLGWKVVSAHDSLTSDTNNYQKFMDILEQEKINFAVPPLCLFSTCIKNNIALPKCLTHIMPLGECLPDRDLCLFKGHVDYVFNSYGCTESIGTLSGVQVDCLDASSNKRSLATMSLFPHGEMKVESGGRLVPRGEPGNVYMRYLICMTCYLDKPEETSKKKSPSGWINTEDLGIIHPSGHLEIIGRQLDIISKSTCKIQPANVQALLEKHPGVEKSLVFGIPDEKHGQEVGACVIPKQGGEVSVGSLKAHCEEHGATAYGIQLFPQYFVIVESFPIFPNGKPDRLKMIELIMGEAKAQGHI